MSSRLQASSRIEFRAKYADRCALFFDGNIVTESEPKTFFSGNSFYTTAANRIARDILPEAVTPDDVIAACGGAIEPEPPLPEYQRIPPAQSVERNKPHGVFLLSCLHTRLRLDRPLRR